MCAALHDAGHELAARSLDDAGAVHAPPVGLFVIDGVRRPSRRCGCAGDCAAGSRSNSCRYSTSRPTPIRAIASPPWSRGPTRICTGLSMRSSCLRRCRRCYASRNGTTSSRRRRPRRGASANACRTCTSSSTWSWSWPAASRKASCRRAFPICRACASPSSIARAATSAAISTTCSDSTSGTWVSTLPTRWVTACRRVC